MIEMNGPSTCHNGENLLFIVGRPRSMAGDLTLWECWQLAHILRKNSRVYGRYGRKPQPAATRGSLV